MMIRAFRFFGFLVIILLLYVGNAFAETASEATKAPQWWEVVGGILAIPVAITGLAYSYVLIHKTRLESRKTELEIKEKETALQQLSEAEHEAALEIVQPIIEGRQAQYLVLRFILLWVVLRLWSLIHSAFGFLINGIMFGTQELTGIDVNNPLVFIPFLIVQYLPQLVTWFIVIGFGWPLFRDVNTFLNIDIKSLLMPWRKQTA